MHNCETLLRSHSSANSQLGHPAGPPHTVHLSSVTCAHAWCLTPSPFAHKATSFTSIFFLQTIQVPGNFIGIARQLILLMPSPFVQFHYRNRPDLFPAFCFLCNTADKANKT